MTSLSQLASRIVEVLSNAAIKAEPQVPRPLMVVPIDGEDVTDGGGIYNDRMGVVKECLVVHTCIFDPTPILILPFGSCIGSTLIKV